MSTQREARLNKDGSPRKYKVLQKPSMASRLAFLELGESEYFPVASNLQGVLNSIQALFVRSAHLKGKKFSTRRYLLVHEDEPTTTIVKVTRVI